MRRIASLMVLVIAGLASLATSPAPRDENGMLELNVAVPAATHVGARRVVVEITRGDGPIQQAVLEAAAGYNEDGRTSPVSSISIVPDDRSEPVSPVRRQAFDFLDDVTQDLTPYCGDGCVRSYTVLVRSESIFDFNAIVSLYAFATASSSNASPGARQPSATIRLSDGQPLAAVPTLRVSITTSLYSDLFVTGVWHGTLRIPAAALDAELVFGSLAMTGRATLDGEKAGGAVWATINGIGERGATLYVDADSAIRFEREWLSACPPGQDCSLPIDVDLRWGPETFLGLDYWLIPGNARVDLTLEARLEYIDRPDLPPGATLELVQR